DEVADYIANLIIADPSENAKWIAKWQAMDSQQLVGPSTCLLQREDISDRLAEISAPALVVHGSEDSAIAPKLAHALCRGLENSEPLVLVDGAAHAANLSHPETVNPAMLDFLRRLAARRG
ncbi:MAG: alpha/beta hydrolase, partial [Pseudomonas marincola]|uniref:alpha/beta fold hydrolase n=2 Tax=Pseudomonas TaxID=286 RepID=UPI0030019FC0